jgi:hypothetical protein
MARYIERNTFQLTVKLSENEFDFITKVANIRQEIKDKNLFMLTDKRIIQRDNIQTHLIGLIGEYAFDRIVYSKNGIDTNAYLHGDISKDFEIYGLKIEIKTLQGYLTFTKINDFIADIAVLVIYNKEDFTVCWIQGWITRHDFIENHFIDNFGYGDRPCIEPKYLQPISTLKTFCLLESRIRNGSQTSRS